MVDIRDMGMPADEVRRRLLQDCGVVVIHGAAYGPGGEGTLRVSFATGGENLNQGLEQLREGLERSQRHEPCLTRSRSAVPQADAAAVDRKPWNANFGRRSKAKCVSTKSRERCIPPMPACTRSSRWAWWSPNRART